MLADRPYQTMCSDASVASSLQRQLIVMATGLGKTITAEKIAKRRGGPLLWLAHTEELVTQAAKSAQLVWPEVSHGIVKAERNEWQRHAVFASIQSAQQDRRIAALASRQWGTIVCDEAHHGLSPGYREVFEAVGCYRVGGPTLLGLTATPERSDQGALDEVFQGIVFQMGITEAIRQGYLIAPTVVERPIRVDLDAVSTNKGDFGQRQLDIALMQAGIVQEITAAYEEQCHDRKSLIFVVSVAQAIAVAESLRARGHAVAAVSGETDKDERRRLLRKLQSGELRCLVNCMVLTEGFDEPSIDAVMLARPTQSKPLMIQMVGRGLRLHPGKSSCLVIDLVGASKRNTLVQAAVLFGVRKDPDEEERKPAAIDPIADPEEYWRQRFLSQIQGVGGAPRSRLRWVPATDNMGWLLPAGEFGTVRMLSQGEEWTVDVVGVREGPSRQQLSDMAVSMDTAQAIAEDYIRRVRAVTLARKDSKWGEEPATDKQVALLTKMGIKGAEKLSKQMASDLLTQKSAEPATSKQLYALRANGIATPAGLTKREASRLFASIKR
jgi:superfamily II DNA or RNA helicase